MKSQSDMIQVATQAVIKASKICLTVQENLVSEDSLSKKDRSPVTVADFGVQAIISQELWQAFPDIPLVGEEDSAQLSKPENRLLNENVLKHVQLINPDMNEVQVLGAIDRGTYTGSSKGCYWCLDPIDGTKGFLRKDQYAIALALIENGEVVFGLLGCPNFPIRSGEYQENRNCVFKAVRGRGAAMAQVQDNELTEWQSINTDSVDNPSDAIFCESFESGHSSHSDSNKIKTLLGIEKPSLRIDSQCKYAIVAKGDASFYLRLPTSPGGKDNPDRYVEKIWDHAAGVILTEEAGGKVTDIYGEALDFSLGRRLEDNVGVIVTNELLHEQVLGTVQEVLGM